jgi:hypothetical protein
MIIIIGNLWEFFEDKDEDAENWYTKINSTAISKQNKWKDWIIKLLIYYSLEKLIIYDSNSNQKKKYLRGKLKNHTSAIKEPC